MHTSKVTRVLILASMGAWNAWGGPAIACKWQAVANTTFSMLAPLRDEAMRADDSPENSVHARRLILDLRKAARPDNAESLLKAGFWIATMQQIRISSDTDGALLLEQAVALRPNDPEYHFFAALAYLHDDKARFLQHWSKARELAKPGSATAINIKIVQGLYSDLID